MVNTSNDPIESLREQLVDRLALEYAGHATRMARDLACSHALLSRYLHGVRVMSGPFILRVKRKIPVLAPACDDALKFITANKWGKENNNNVNA